ncbi:hypothetical protein CORC01_11065 [Colletotrichum orchidophilum]|uniref:Secondary alcohol dehydrogenase n=1 Tax=Colletotrichum orchidophilum TaxID=1209926 RepID=A0A1G4AX85_9PEZI|nr:uncharacterized protein CORC01_11065 [Colletotrichum orchidophilum]OHE93662.1 hypothetical protein CORC01_11065 [Colletotrichum orchidophilum]
MSADTRPISPTQFASALRDLSLPTLHLKALEIRNSILHLEYSNAQLAPYAAGDATTLDSATDASAGRPDPTCVEAIRENDVVITRMRERVQIIRDEVEGRGHSWNEFKSKEEVEEEEGRSGAALRGITSESITGANGVNGNGIPATNGLGAAAAEENRIAAGHQGAAAATNGGSSTTTTSSHPAWMDGTFQMGTIRNGVITMDDRPEQPAQAAQQANGTGGRLTDEELRQAMEERMRGLGDDDEDGGMHL